MIQLTKEFSELSDYWEIGVEEKATNLAIMMLADNLLKHRQFCNHAYKELDEDPDIEFSHNNLSQLNEALFNGRVKISVNPDIPDCLYIHIAGTARQRAAMDKKLQSMSDVLEKDINSHLQDPYFRLIIIDDGEDLSQDLPKTDPGARGRRKLPPIAHAPIAA